MLGNSFCRLPWMAAREAGLVGVQPLAPTTLGRPVVHVIDRDEENIGFFRGGREGAERWNQRDN